MNATKLARPGGASAQAAAHPRRKHRALALAALIAAALASCTPEGPRPDVVLVTIDTLRADHCSAYGYEIDTTPVLEKMAKGGVLFRRAYSESSTTAPSHAVLLTSRHFRTLGVGKNGAVLEDDAVTLAETLRSEGYDTAAFISSFPLLSRFGFDQGFDFYDDHFELDQASLGRRKEGSTPHDRLGEATFARVESWFAGRSEAKPLFLWVHFVDPHAPYRAPERFDGKWKEGLRGVKPRYDSEVRYADKQLGRLLDLVAARTPTREDLAVVTSDHGEGLGDHGALSHGVNLYEEAVRVPLVASWPGRLEAGRVVEEPVSIVDVARSILDSLAIEAPTFAHGRNIFAANDPDRPIFLQRRDYRSQREKGQSIRGSMTAVVESGQKLVFAPDEDRRELYDLGADPAELRNLVGPPPRQRRSDRRAANPALPPPARTPDQSANDAHRLEGRIVQWQDALPETGTDEPLDEETRKALRALGYVD